MRTFRASCSASCIAGYLIFASTALAQTQLIPRIHHIMPMGGQGGSTFELKVSGEDLADVQGLHFNFPGVEVEVGSSEKTFIPVIPTKKRQKLPPPPPLLTYKFKVKLPADAPLGIQDVRIVTKAGVSNPRAFVVGDLKETVEIESNDDVPQAQKIELNSSVSGVILQPTDVDYFVFTGKKGQRVVCACQTTSIDSRLPASLQLYSAEGANLGFNRNYDGNDAVLDVTLPADGEYYVRVSGFSYTLGGIDYFYRLTVSTAPWIDAVFPPVVEPGKETQVTVYGRNLPGGKFDPTTNWNESVLEKVIVKVKPPRDPLARQRLAYSGLTQPHATMLDGFDLRLKNGVGTSNPYLLTFAAAPVVLDQGDNDEQEKAQKVTVPCVIAGHIEKKSDRDWYSFTAKKGSVWSIEAFAERLGSPMDLYFQLRDEKGGLIVEQDDTGEVMSPQLFSRTDDPQRYWFTAPADGTYSILVTSRDAFTQASPRHNYTVRVTPEEPNFQLVAMPQSQIGPEANRTGQGGGTAYTVYVWRHDGFNADITLSGVDLPPGIKVHPQVISGNQKQGIVIVHADAGMKPWLGPIKVVGTATVKGKKLVREVRSATISWTVLQPNAPTITRMDRELVLAVREHSPYTLVVGTDKIIARQGEKISIPVKISANADFKGPVQIAAVGPAGLNSRTLALTAGKGNAAAGKVEADAKGAPGNYTIFLRGQPPQGMTKPGSPGFVQFSPPVQVTIVPKELAKVTLAPATAKIPLGKEAAITVKAARQFDPPGALKVEAILPAKIKGLTAKLATISAGEKETKLVFTAEPSATISANVPVTIRVTGIYNDSIPVVHEAKLTLSITK